MNIHAGEVPVNQSRRAEGGVMSHIAVEGMCANSGLGHSITNFCKHNTDISFNCFCFPSM